MQGGTGPLTEGTARYGEYLDALPGRLVAQLLCEIRDVSAEEASQLAGPYGRTFSRTLAIQPTNDGATPLLLGRYDLDGGHACAMAFGFHARSEFPDSYAQPSDVDSGWLVAETTQLVGTVVDGCTEFRRPFTPDVLSKMLAAYGPPTTPAWTVGVESRHGRSARTSDDPGEPFEVRWLPWQWRV